MVGLKVNAPTLFHNIRSVRAAVGDRQARRGRSQRGVRLVETLRGRTRCGRVRDEEDALAAGVTVNVNDTL
jgi:hypothetical protein